MMTPLVQTPEAITLLGGGGFAPADLQLALSLAPVLVAADGGADAALAAGHLPRAVIGDFDSVSPATLAAIPPDRLHRIDEQDSTDFGKCLRSVAAPFLIAVGFTGARFDHALAAMSALVRHPQQSCVILGAEEVIFLAPPRLSLPLAAGTRVSLFPMGPVRGQSRGLRWPIDGIDFAPAGRIGTSNEATGPVELEVEGPMLVLLPRDLLAPALAALSAGRGAAAPDGPAPAARGG